MRRTLRIIVHGMLACGPLACPGWADAQAAGRKDLAPHSAPLTIDEARARALRAARARAAARAADYAGMIESAALRNAVPADLVRAVISSQSGYNARAETPRGARGLMPLLPETASTLGVGDAFDPEQNIEAGTRHLRAMLDQFAGDVPRALTAFSAGAIAAAQYGIDVPDAEVRNSVARVLRAYRHALRQAGGNAVAARRPESGAAVRERGVRSELWRYTQDERTVVYTNVERRTSGAR